MKDRPLFSALEVTIRMNNQNYFCWQKRGKLVEAEARNISSIFGKEKIFFIKISD